MAENAGFLTLSFLKKERETVLIKFSPNLQKVAENTNNLHWCWIFSMLLLEKYKNLLHSLNHIFAIQKKTVKSGTVTEPVRCHPVTPLLKVQAVKSPGEGPSLHFSLIYKFCLEDEIHKHLLFFSSLHLTIYREGQIVISCFPWPSRAKPQWGLCVRHDPGEKGTQDLSMGVGGKKSHISKMTASHQLMPRDKGVLLGFMSFCRDTLKGWLVGKSFY